MLQGSENPYESISIHSTGMDITQLVTRYYFMSQINCKENIIWNVILVLFAISYNKA